MRFFKISKRKVSKDQVDYFINLYLDEVKKESFPEFIDKQTREFTFSLGDGLMLSYYHYEDQPQDQMSFTRDITIHASYAKNAVKCANMISTIPSLRFEYVIKFLLAGGWTQVFEDNRNYGLFFEKNMPPQNFTRYSANISCTQKDENGDKDGYSEYFDMFCASIEQARSGVMAESAERLQLMNPDSHYAKFKDRMLKALADWMTSGMYFYHIRTISKDDFDWNFTSVRAHYLLDLVTKKEEVKADSNV